MSDGKISSAEIQTSVAKASSLEKPESKQGDPPQSLAVAGDVGMEQQLEELKQLTNIGEELRDVRGEISEAVESSSEGLPQPGDSGKNGLKTARDIALEKHGWNPAETRESPPSSIAIDAWKKEDTMRVIKTGPDAPPKSRSQEVEKEADAMWESELSPDQSEANKLALDIAVRDCFRTWNLDLGTAALTAFHESKGDARKAKHWTPIEVVKEGKYFTLIQEVDFSTKEARDTFGTKSKEIDKMLTYAMKVYGPRYNALWNTDRIEDLATLKFIFKEGIIRGMELVSVGDISQNTSQLAMLSGGNEGAVARLLSVFSGFEKGDGGFPSNTDGLSISLNHEDEVAISVREMKALGRREWQTVPYVPKEDLVLSVRPDKLENLLEHEVKFGRNYSRRSLTGKQLVSGMQALYDIIPHEEMSLR